MHPIKACLALEALGFLKGNHLIAEKSSIQSEDMDLGVYY